VTEIVPPLKLWSVTTLIKLGLGTSEALVNWAVGATAEAAVDSLPTVQTMYANEGRDAVVAWLKRRRFEQNETARVRGSDLHKHFEAIALGQEPPPVPEGGQPYIDQWRRWLDTFQPTFLMAEAPVYNVTHHYAGTLDAIVQLDGHPLILDYKTTPHPPGGEKSRPPFPEVALQLVAYRRAEEVGVISEQRYSGGKRYYLYDPTQTHESMPEVEGALCVVVSPFDCVAHAIATDERVWRSFGHVYEAARWQLAGSQGVIGPALAPSDPSDPREVANVDA
jgi:hypothetical protein